VHATLTAPLALAGGGELPPMVEASALAREVEFAFPLVSALAERSGLVRGFMDALIAWDDELWVLDYKSDVLAGDPMAAAERRVREHYAVQARLYAIAAERLRGARQFAGLLFSFVRHGVTVPVRVDGITLANWTMWLAGVRA
jgi:ATP-dependent exoDNAse (exonuclease V) beta subunit